MYLAGAAYVGAEHQQDMSTADKVRLFICYCATHPEKLDEEKMSKWMKAARLSQHDMVTVTNIALLGCNVFPPREWIQHPASGTPYRSQARNMQTDLFTRVTTGLTPVACVHSSTAGEEQLLWRPKEARSRRRPPA